VTIARIRRASSLPRFANQPSVSNRHERERWRLTRRDASAVNAVVVRRPDAMIAMLLRVELPVSEIPTG